MTRIICKSYGTAENCAAWFRRRDIKAVQSGDHVTVTFKMHRNGQFRDHELSLSRCESLLAQARARYGREGTE